MAPAPRAPHAARKDSDRLVLAVDGGNAKTDLALVQASGRVLALVRGGRSSPHYVGLNGCIKVLEQLRAEAMSRAGLASDRRERVDAAALLVAGADLPEELEALRARIKVLDWSERLLVDNDTLALLRSGSDRGWGVAVVCGSGINCIGIGPDGRQLRFPSLGEITGDWGGGSDVGLAAVMAAARSADGRGPQTALEAIVPAHFGLAEPFELARALHLHEIPDERLRELAPLVFAAAEDGVAVGADGDEGSADLEVDGPAAGGAGGAHGAHGVPPGPCPRARTRTVTSLAPSASRSRASHGQRGRARQQ